MKDPVVYTLTTPVEIGGTVYEQLTLREPLGRQLKQAWNSNQMAMTIKLISIVAKVPEAVPDSMTQTDLMAAGEILGNFTEPSPETGENSSPT